VPGRPAFGHKIHLAQPSSAAAADTTPGSVDVQLTDFLYRRYGRAQKSQTGTTTFSVEGFSNATASGTLANFNDATGLYNSFTTGAVIGNSAGITGGNFTSDWTRIDWSPTVFYRMKTGTDPSSQRIYAGMYATAPTSSDTPPDNSVCFRYSTAAADTTWQAFSRNASTQTQTDTGVTIAGDTLYNLLIVTTPTSALFYIDNDLVASHGSTTLPVAGTDMSLSLTIFTLAAATRAVRISIETSMTY
jgi:hypothetical protein